MNGDPYQTAQQAMGLLKGAVIQLLARHYPNGLKNVDIGKCLGIYMGHKGHSGHIPRTILELLEHEECVVQNEESKVWTLAAEMAQRLNLLS